MSAVSNSTTKVQAKVYKSKLRQPLSRQQYQLRFRQRRKRIAPIVCATDNSTSGSTSDASLQDHFPREQQLLRQEQPYNEQDSAQELGELLERLETDQQPQHFRFHDLEDVDLASEADREAQEDQLPFSDSIAPLHLDVDPVLLVQHWMRQHQEFCDMVEADFGVRAPF